MPEISRFLGIVIYMQTREHPPPHLHAKYEGKTYSFSILTGEPLAGRPDVRISRKVSEWIKLHRQELLENWDLLWNKQAPRKIAPLD